MIWNNSSKFTGVFSNWGNNVHAEQIRYPQIQTTLIKFYCNHLLITIPALILFGSLFFSTIKSELIKFFEDKHCLFGMKLFQTITYLRIQRKLQIGFLNCDVFTKKNNQTIHVD